jgi:2-iminobutanoate/2-iminopropanoate deaminase
MKFYRMDGNKAAGLPFSDAVQVGDVVYLSGQMGVLPGTMKLAEGGIEGETRQMMENIQRVLTHCGLGLNDVFKCTVMLADMANWPAFNKIYLPYFKPDHLPTRSAFGANGLALGGAVEMECWAHNPPSKGGR